MPPYLLWLVWLLATYLVGSIPFGLLIGWSRGVDIRAAGSGNLGATNVGRVLGRGWGITCFLLDVAKGLVPVALFGALGYPPIASALVEAAGETGGGRALAALAWLTLAAAAMAGHIFPVYLRFRGGKGVATGLGVVLGLWPVLTFAGLGAAVLWLIVIKASGYVSLASLCAAVALPVLTALSGLALGLTAAEIAVYAAVTVLLAALVILRHRTNIARLRAGTEPRAAWARRSA